MTWLGVLLTTLAGIGLGLYYSRRLYRRVDFLQQTAGVLEAVGHRLAYAPRPMGDLWQALAAGQAFNGFRLVTDTVAALDHAPFADAFRQAVDRAAEDGLVTAEDRQLLFEFAEGCGRLDLAGQTAHIRAYQSRLTAAATRAREAAAAKGQVYQMLGVAGGVGLSLLLL